MIKLIIFLIYSVYPFFLYPTLVSDFELADKLYRDGKYSESLIEFKKNADEKNDPEAQYRLALMYFYGEGTNVNLELSYKYAKKSVDNEYILSFYFLSHMHSRYGYGAEYDKEKEKKLQILFFTHLKDIYSLSKEGNIFATMLLADAFELGFYNDDEMYLRSNKVSNKFVMKAKDQAEEQSSFFPPHLLSLLASFYWDKEDDTRNFQYHLEHFETGSVEGIKNLGILYISSDNEDIKDWEKAAEYMKIAAEKKDPLAIWFHATEYLNGILGITDYEYAFEKYKECAEMRFFECQTKVANAYQMGYGIEKDEKKSLEMFEKLYEQGLDVAYNIGKLKLSRSRKKEDIGDEEVLEYFKECANDTSYDFLSCTYEIGNYYKEKAEFICPPDNDTGKCIEHPDPKEEAKLKKKYYKKAIKWYQKTIDERDCLYFDKEDNRWYDCDDWDLEYAYLDLADLYKLGYATQKNLSKHFDLLEECHNEKRGYWCTAELSTLYGEGNEKVKKNLQKSNELLFEIANPGDYGWFIFSARWLGNNYYKGTGVNKDLILGYMWLLRATNTIEYQKGDEDYSADINDIDKNIEELSKILSSEQIEEAKKLAFTEELKPITSFSKKNIELLEEYEPREELIKKIQKELKENGYEIKKINGKINKQTKEAIEDFNNELPKTEHQWSDLHNKLIERKEKKMTTEKQKNNNQPSWTGLGTGVIINREGYVLTNFHVVQDCDEIKLGFSDTLKPVILNRKLDIAILKNPLNKELNNVVFRSSSPNAGENLWALGYGTQTGESKKEFPLGISPGVVNAERVEGIKGMVAEDWFQHNATIQHGHSGGPILDNNGYLIGLISSSSPADYVAAQIINYGIKNTPILLKMKEHGINHFVKEKSDEKILDGTKIKNLADTFTKKVSCWTRGE